MRLLGREGGGIVLCILCSSYWSSSWRPRLRAPHPLYPSLRTAHSYCLSPTCFPHLSPSGLPLRGARPDVPQGQEEDPGRHGGLHTRRHGYGGHRQPRAAHRTLPTLHQVRGSQRRGAEPAPPVLWVNGNGAHSSRHQMSGAHGRPLPPDDPPIPHLTPGMQGEPRPLCLHHQPGGAGHSHAQCRGDVLCRPAPQCDGVTTGGPDGRGARLARL